MKSPRHKSARWLKDAAVYQQAGDVRRAADCYRRYLREHPDHAGVLHTLGGLCYQLKELEAAGAYLEKAHRAEPENLDYLNDLGAFRLVTKQYPAAVACLSLLVGKAPDNHMAHYNLGLALHATGRLAEAIHAFEQAIQLQPDFTAAVLNLAICYEEIGQTGRAETAYRRALELDPHLLDAHLRLGTLLAGQKREEAAIAVLRKASALDRDNPKVVVPLADLLDKLGRTGEGIQVLQEALTRRPEDVQLLISLGTLMRRAGRFEETEAIYQKILATTPDSALCCYEYARSRKFGAGNSDRDTIRKMEAILKQTDLPDNRRMMVCFALGKIHDDCKQYEQAFHYYQLANGISRDKVCYQREEHEKKIENIITVFNEDFFAEYAGTGSESERPLFIVGMPRSGTTLTEQILVSHPAVAGAGELLFFPHVIHHLPYLLGSDQPYPWCCRTLGREHAAQISENYLALLARHSPTARFVTDKYPMNFFNLGLMRLVFPQAHIIHCRRDPLDVCLSIYFQYFNEQEAHACDLLDIGHYYLQYARLMEHWRKALPGPFLEIRYEDLVAEQEKWSKAVIAFCGLEWDEGCLRFHESKRDIRTPSDWQVRQPMYTGSLRRWKNYEKHLAPLVQLFRSAEDKSSEGKIG